MSLISLFIYWLLGFLLGILGFIVLPVFAPKSMAYGIAQWYWGLSLAAYRRVVCLFTPRNTASFVRSSWDGERQTEQIQVDGNDNDLQDPRASTLRCKTRPFAFAFSDKNRIIHPADAEVGRMWKRAVEAVGRFKEFQLRQRVQTDGGEDDEPKFERVTVTAGLGHIGIDPQPQAVDMQYADVVIPESHEPNDTHRTEEDIKKSQEGFRSMPAIEAIMLLFACMGGTGAAWFIYSNTSGGGDSIVTVPISIMFNLVGVLI